MTLTGSGQHCVVAYSFACQRDSLAWGLRGYGDGIPKLYCNHPAAEHLFCHSLFHHVTTGVTQSRDFQFAR